MKIASTKKTWVLALASTVLAGLLASAPLSAQQPQPVAQQPQPVALQGIGIDQKLNQQVPLDLPFRDARGKTVKLGDYFGQRPVVLSLVYYQCPMLCPMALNGALRSFRALSLDIGKDYEVVTVSISPTETPDMAAEKKATYVKQYGREGGAAGWHFLTGEQASIQRLADAVGFRYTYDPETGMYSHATAIMVLTPEGRVARYFYGIEYSARDLRLGLVEAGKDKIGTPVDQVLLYCFQYDPTTGKYGLLIMRVLRLAGLATVLALGAFLLVALRGERKPRHQNGNQQLKEV
jgi:protein SCO1/2